MFITEGIIQLSIGRIIMEVENEFKFTTDRKLEPADVINSLESFLKDHSIPYEKKVRQSQDRYYDSNTLELYRKGCSLRQKNTFKGKVKLTAKKPLSNEGEMMSREEIEMPADGRFMTLKAFGKGCFPDITIEKDPVLQMRTERTAFYYTDGADVMLTFDTCRYISGKRHKDFLEVEIESMGKSTERGFDHIGMRDFVKELSFYPVTKSKYQRGIEWIQSLNVQI